MASDLHIENRYLDYLSVISRSIYFLVLLTFTIWCFVSFKINIHFATMAKLYAFQRDDTLSTANKKEQVIHFIFNTLVQQ